LKITVIIPTYNEAENLPKIVSALFLIPLEINLLVVDDDSPDGTGRLAEDLTRTYSGRMSVVHRLGKLGLRTAYMDGFEAAYQQQADVIVQMDADFSHDPKCLPEMVKCLEKADLVLGSRYVRGGGVDKNWPIWRKALSAWANFYARTLLRMPIRDVTTGYRMWRVGGLRQLPLERVKSNGYIFLVEMAYLAYRKGLKMVESPIYFTDRKLGQSKMSFKIQLEAAMRIWQLLWNYRDLRRR
jgi:dolichol-phosphate mannosyltransferase